MDYKIYTKAWFKTAATSTTISQDNANIWGSPYFEPHIGSSSRGAALCSDPPSSCSLNSISKLNPNTPSFPYMSRSHRSMKPCFGSGFGGLRGGLQPWSGFGGSRGGLQSCVIPSSTFCFFRGDEDPIEASGSGFDWDGFCLSSTNGTASEAFNAPPSFCCSSMIFCKYFPCASILICNCLCTYNISI